MAVEVLSESTADEDYHQKSAKYPALAEVQRLRAQLAKRGASPAGGPAQGVQTIPAAELAQRVPERHAAPGVSQRGRA